MLPACITHDLTIKPTENIKYDPSLTVKEILENLQDSGYEKPLLWLRNEIIDKMQCLNSDYPNQSFN